MFRGFSCWAFSELTSLKIADLRIRDRSGEVRVREGKGNKEREVPAQRLCPAGSECISAAAS